LDLAIVKFRSSRNYAVASVGASSSLESGVEIYVAGFPAATSTIGSGVFNFTKGEVTGNATNPNSKGYSLIYNSITLPGMRIVLVSSLRFTVRAIGMRAAKRLVLIWGL
jgi:hypothetical protein